MIAIVILFICFLLLPLILGVSLFVFNMICEEFQDVKEYDWKVGTEFKHEDVTKFNSLNQ